MAWWSTSVSVSSNLNPSNVGQSVTFTATVANNCWFACSNPTGTVTFKDGSTVLGTSNLSSGGTATYSTATLASGTHNITAVYSGDGNYNGSTSSVYQQVVNLTPSSVTIASSIDPSTVGSAVTFTAVVTPSNATGVVTFYDGSNSIGCVGVNNYGSAGCSTSNSSTATLTTSALAVGTHTILASFYNANYTLGQATLTQYVLNTSYPYILGALPDGVYQLNATDGSYTSGGSHVNVVVVVAGCVLNNNFSVTVYDNGTEIGPMSTSYGPVVVPVD